MPIAGCGTLDQGMTTEQINAKAQLERQRFEMQQEKEELEHKRQLELIQAKENLVNTTGYADYQSMRSQQEQAESLKYLEGSQKVHDTVEGVAV